MCSASAACRPVAVVGYGSQHSPETHQRQYSLAAASLRCRDLEAELKIARLLWSSRPRLPAAVHAAGQWVWLCTPVGCASPLIGVLALLFDVVGPPGVSLDVRPTLRNAIVHANISDPDPQFESAVAKQRRARIAALTLSETPQAPTHAFDSTGSGCWDRELVVPGIGSNTLVFYTSFSHCCYPLPTGNSACWQGTGLSFMQCCQDLFWGRSNACFDDDAYQNCCIRGRETTHVELAWRSGSVWQQPSGERCWQKGPQARSFDSCCFNQHNTNVGLSGAELVLALRRTYSELIRVQSSLMYAEHRILQMSQRALVQGPCPAGADLVSSAAYVSAAPFSFFPPFQLCVRRREDTLDSLFRLRGSWDCQILHHVSSRLSTARGSSLHIVDVGANIGTCAVGLAHSGHYVSAIEANPESALLLNASIAANRLQKRLCLTAAAASTRKDVGVLSAPCHNSAHSMILTSNAVENKTFSDICGSYKIKMDILPYLLRHRRPVDIIKVDVEGNEFAVICGAVALFLPTRHGRGKGPVVIFEFIPRWLQTHAWKELSKCEPTLGDGILAVSLLRFFTRFEYAVYKVVTSEDAPAYWHHVPASDFGKLVYEAHTQSLTGNFMDLVAVPEEKVIELGLKHD